MSKKFPVFTVKIDDKDVELTVKEPTQPQQQDSLKAYNSAFKDAITSGALLRAKLDDFVREQGLWNDEKQAELTKIQRETFDLEKKLAKGGYKKDDAKRDCFKISDLRDDRVKLLAPRSALDTHTAEGQADNARFNSLVASCVIYHEGGGPLFKDLGDYLNKSSEVYAAESANHFAKEYYQYNDDQDKKLPENKFLVEFGYYNDKLELVNDEGHLVDREGKRINSEGMFVADDGETIVDENGVLVDEDGNYVYKDALPFLDDDGEPVVVENKEGEKEDGDERAEDEQEEEIEQKVEEVETESVLAEK